MVNHLYYDKFSDKYLPLSLNNSGFSFHAFWHMINKPLDI